MVYRKLGRTGLEVGEIGLGLEHLLPKEQTVITDTIRTAIQGGVNYLDCLSQKDFAENSDTNEEFVKLGNALEGLRDKVYITYLANSQHSIDGIKIGFECFLKELKTDYADVFIVAYCDKISEFDRITGSGSLFEYAQQLQSENKVKFIGISTHSASIAHKVIESGYFDVLMYPVNPAFDVVDDEEKFIEDDLGKLWDAAYEYKSDDKKDIKLPRKDIYSECLKNNIGLVAMKPFGGGFLFRPDMNTGFTPVNLISYALQQTGISTVVPGCANKEEIEKILKYYSATKEELDFSKYISQSRWNIKGSCQYCNHCLPCAADIDIAQINRIFDNKSISEYSSLEVKPSACIECGECETRCPFEVKIMEKMKSAVKLFE